MAIENITFESGYMVLSRTGGRDTRYPIASVLRALDIPTGLTYTQITAITTLANLLVTLIRTLISKGAIADSFLEEGEIDLGAIIEVIEEMGGDYELPDLSTTKP